MHFVITGGKGFIGTSLVENLSSKGHLVTNWTNEVSALKRELVAGPVDLIIHLAHRRKGGFELEFDENNGALLKLLKVAEYFKCPINFTSSAAVYGNFLDDADEQTPLRPLSDYGRVKASMEDTLLSWSSKHQIPVGIWRIYNPYGYHPDRKYLISDLLNSMATRTPIKISYPEDRRDFILLSDLVEVLVRFIERFIKEKRTKILNVGMGQAVSVREAVNIFEEVTRKHIPVEWGKGSSMIPYSCCSNKSMLEYLHWAPGTSLREGLVNLALNG